MASQYNLLWRGAQDEELRTDLVSGLRAKMDAMQRIALKVTLSAHSRPLPLSMLLVHVRAVFFAIAVDLIVSSLDRLYFEEISECMNV